MDVTYKETLAFTVSPKDLWGVPDKIRRHRKSNLNEIEQFCVACKKPTCSGHSTVNINRELKCTSG